MCITPKLACSTITDYILWSVVGPPIACDYGPSHAIDYKAKCPSAHTKTRYDLANFPEPLALKQGKRSGTHVIVYRDPWKRLLSGYRSKFMSACHSNRTCFRHYIKDITMDERHTNLEAYFISVVMTPNHRLDLHFRPQYQQCMGQGKRQRNAVLLNIDIDTNMTVLQTAWDLPPYDSIIQGRMYEWRPAKCERVARDIMRRVVHWLDYDYSAVQSSNPIQVGDVFVCPHNNTIIPAGPR